jgi:hypothetical protein
VLNGLNSLLHTQLGCELTGVGSSKMYLISGHFKRRNPAVQSIQGPGYGLGAWWIEIWFNISYFCLLHSLHTLVTIRGSFSGSVNPTTSPPCSTEVKNAWSYTSTSQYVFKAWCCMKQLYLRCMVGRHRGSAVYLYPGSHQFEFRKGQRTFVAFLSLFTLHFLAVFIWLLGQGPVNLCWSSLAQSSLVSVPVETHDLVPRPFMCFEILPRLRREEWLVFLNCFTRMWHM